MQPVTEIVDPSHGPVWIEATSFGASSTPLGATLGFQHAEMALGLGECQAIVLVRSAAQFDAANKLRREIGDKCVVNAGGE